MKLTRGLLIAALTCVAACAAAAEAPSTLTPYLQNPTADGMTVCLLSREVQDVHVTCDREGYSHSMDVAATSAAIPDTPWTVWKARLGGLQAGTKYAYQVGYRLGAAKRTTPSYHFRTLDPQANTLRLAAFNDIHQHDGTLAALMRYVKPDDFEFSLLLGDCLEGDQHSVIRAWSTYLQLLDAANKPVLFVRGNHETRSFFAKRLAYLMDLPNLDARAPWGKDQWQYTLRAGPVWFVAMDTCEDDDESTPETSYKNPKLWQKVRKSEAGWLKTVAVKKNDAPWRIFLSHIPLYNNNPWWCHGGRGLWEASIRRIDPQLMLAGHDHHWKLLRPGEGVRPPWPVLIGGGPSLGEGTVMLLTADRASLNVRLLAAKDGRLRTEFKTRKEAASP
jgi:acid phosphatase type 7